MSLKIDFLYSKWPFIIAFLIVIIAVIMIDVVYEQGTKKEIKSLEKLKIEQSKQDGLSRLYDLRTQLKVSLQQVLVKQNEKELKALFSEINKIREDIINESVTLRLLSKNENELKVLDQHIQALESGLNQQFYFQTLVLDMQDLAAAEDLIYRKIIPIQDYADSLLSDYYKLVSASIQFHNSDFLLKKQQTHDVLDQLKWFVLVLILCIAWVVVWLVNTSSRQQKQFSQSLEDKVELRTAELHDAESKLKNSLANLESVLKAAPDGVITTDRKATILGVNPAIQNMFGYLPDELIGQNVTVLIPHEFRAAHPSYVENFDLNRLNTASRMGKNDSGRVKGLHKNGEVFPLEAAIGHVKSSNQEGFTIIIRDVSHNVSIENRLQQQKSLLETLWQANNQFMLYQNINEVADSLLEKALSLTGSEYGFIGEILYDESNNPYLKTHAITNIAWNDETKQFYEENSPQGLEFRNLETLFGKAILTQKTVISNDAKNDPDAGGIPEGHPALNTFLGVPVFYANKIVGMYGLANRKGGYDDEIVDILKPFSYNYGSLVYVKRMLSKQTEMHKELLSKRDQAEKASQAKSEFLSSMSHELRTPLNAVLGFSQLLEMGDLTSSQKDTVAEIVKAGNHLLELINSVLDLAKIESGHMDVNIDNVCLSELLNECISLIQPSAKRKNITISSTELLKNCVRVDRRQFKQVLINVLSNAVKYNVDNGRIDITLEEVEDMRIHLNIIDTGQGIPESQVSGLFQPFNRLGHEGGAIEGSGVGLSISQALMELMGGNILYRPNKPQGSCFTIELKALPLNHCHSVESLKNI